MGGLNHWRTSPNKKTNKGGEQVHANIENDPNEGEIIFVIIQGQNIFVQSKAKGVVNKNFLLLDNQSTVNQIANPSLLKNIRKSSKLGWKFQFLVAISGTPIGSRILFHFWFQRFRSVFFWIPLLKNREIRILIPKLGFPKKYNIGIQYISFQMRHQS
jgi:hypothetical protein